MTEEGRPARPPTDARKQPAPASMKPAKRDMKLPILIACLCLIGWNCPVRAQVSIRPQREQTARILRDYPFRCTVRGQLFAADEFHDRPFPLEGAHVWAYCTADSAQLQTTAPTLQDGRFYCAVWGKGKPEKPEIRVVITYVGMDTLDCVLPAVKTRDAYGPAYEVRMDSAVLHSRPVTLEEAQIIGELKKMYQRGDTTVFNVDAYEMPEGTVLLQLVRRLPGLRYDDGQLTYKGRTIEEMRLNGDSFFKHDISIALQNMPNMKLKQVEVYETDRDSLDVTQGRMLVMDMKSKEDIRDVLFANAEAGTADQKRKYMAFGDMNFYRRNGPQFSLGGRLQDMPNGETAEDKSIRQEVNGFYAQRFEKAYVNTQSGFQYTRNAGRTVTATNSFLPENTTYDRSESQYDNRNKRFNAGVSGNVRLGEKTTMRNNLYFSHVRSSSTSRTSSLSTAGEARDTLNLNTEEQRNTSEEQSARWTAFLSRKVADDDEAGIRGFISYRKETGRTERHSHTTFFSLSDSLLDVSQLQEQPKEQLAWNAAAYYHIKFRKKHTLSLSYGFQYSKDDERTDYTDLTAGPVLTDSLSYRSASRMLRHELQADLILDWERARLSATFILSPARKELSTARRDGQSVRRNYTALLHSQSILFHSLLGEDNSIDLSYYGEKSMPYDELLIFIPDYSDPLNVRTGNPDLKNPYRLRTELSVSTLQSKMQLNVNYSNTRNATDYRVVFDPETGGRLYMPDNINGNYDLGSQLSYYTVFGQLTWNSTVAYRYQHAAKFMQYAGESQASRNIGENHGIQIGLSPSYSRTFLTTELNATYTLDRRSNRSMEQGNYRLQQYRAEWNAKVFIGHNWELETRLDWSYRKGMQTSNDNGSECVWDLGVAYKFFRQQGTVRLNAFDLLHKRKNYTTYFGNNFWTETRRDGKTEYIRLSVAYRFNRM